MFGRKKTEEEKKKIRQDRINSRTVFGKKYIKCSLVLKINEIEEFEIKNNCELFQYCTENYYSSFRYIFKKNG